MPALITLSEADSGFVTSAQHQAVDAQEHQRSAAQLTVQWHARGHHFGEEEQTQAWAWLAQHI